MAESLKFICVIIILISSFIAAKSIDGVGRRTCFRDKDCAKNMCPSYLDVKCLKSLCKCARPEFQ